MAWLSPVNALTVAAAIPECIPLCLGGPNRYRRAVKTGRIVIVGGGAAGFLAAVTSAEAGGAREVMLRRRVGRRGLQGRGAEAGGAREVMLLEKTAQFLTKVRISGGGRCNVTHACFTPRELAAHYPRGGAALISAFAQFQPADTVAWFATRGVTLKTESDGRMFPTTDSSQTITDCLWQAARRVGVILRSGCGVEQIARRPSGGFTLTLTDGTTLACDRVLLATGGCRTPAHGRLAEMLGHTLAAPVPSLFTLQMAAPWLRSLAGISVPAVEVAVAGTRLRERGALLVTHRGLSGPAILRLSAWGARVLHERAYTGTLQVNWLPDWRAETLAREWQVRRQTQPARRVVNSPIAPLPSRLWEQLVRAAGVGADIRWAELTRTARHQLSQQLLRTELPINGKSLNRDEFVTCGGVRLAEVNFKTMESRLCPGLFFAGELLDVDGLTGGFNLQAAWTTGWIAGRALAGKSGRD